MTATGRAGRDSLELTVDVPEDGSVKALAYPSVVGIPEVGDEVLRDRRHLAADVERPAHGAVAVGVSEALSDRVSDGDEIIKQQKQQIADVKDELGTTKHEVKVQKRKAFINRIETIGVGVAAVLITCMA